MEHCKQEPLSDIESECAELNYGENSAKSQDVPCKEENLDIKDEVQPLSMVSSVIKTEPQDVWSEDEEMDVKNEINPMAVVETTNQDDACSEDEEMDVKHKINPMTVVTSTMEATNQDAENVSLIGGNDTSTIMTVKTESATQESVSEESKSIDFHLCKICDVSFKDSQDLEVHLQIHKESYPKKEEEDYDDDEEEEEDDDDNDDVKPSVVPTKTENEDNVVYSCKVCESTFDEERNLDIHMVEHTNSLVCHKCQKSFKRKGFLINHLFTCSTKDLYRCHVCKKKLRSKELYEGHMRLHKGDKTFSCQECGRVFSLHHSLINHMRNVHENIRPFVCHICNKTSYSKNDLKKHLMVHTGERPFPCPVCGKSFNQKSNVQKHMILHGVYQHVCEFCNKSYDMKRGLLNHLRIAKHSSPYKCELCNKFFVIQKDFERHVCLKSAKKD